MLVTGGSPALAGSSGSESPCSASHALVRFASSGTVVSARWTRSLLDWYTEAEKDPDAAREAAELFAHRYVITESFLGSLQKLRSAGLQLVDGRGAGLVRDYRFARLSEAEVNGLFDAIAQGFDNA